MPTPGHIARIRLSPKDCMSVVDTLDHLGIATANLSFATAVKLVMSAALESFRQQGIIKERSGFEYSEVMAPFLHNSTPHTVKLVSSALVTGEHVQIKPVIPEDPVRAARRRMYDELFFRWKQDPQNFDDMETLAPLIEEFQPAT